MGTEDKSRYYGEISAAFLRLRGAPFILSGRELHVLAGWEKQGIPLNAVMEGIESAFSSLQKKAEPGRRAVSLHYCDSFVQRAFDQVKDRRTGGARRAGGRENKKADILRAVTAFLDGLPEELFFLKRFYEKALRLAESAEDREEDLESLEAEIEGVLEAHCPAEEWDRAQRELEVEAAGVQGEERARLVRRLALRSLRGKYKIPYVSFPFY
jgi:hypothetical protein